MEYCKNCGHQCHCGSPCMKEHTDGDGKKIEIECKWSPDYEKIADEALNSLDDMKRIQIQQLKAACNF